MARLRGSLSPLVRRRIAVLAAVGACLTVHACSGDRVAERICPQVQILEYADSVTAFASGAGRDVTDVVLQGTLDNLDGECTVEKDKVALDIVVEFALKRGPANRTRKARFAYFVAIEEFRPAPGGKRVFPVEVEFEAGRNRARYRDAVAIEIPLTGKMNARDFNVFVGIQLERDQLEFNRSAGPARG